MLVFLSIVISFPLYFSAFPVLGTVLVIYSLLLKVLKYEDGLNIRSYKELLKLVAGIQYNG